MAVSDPLRLRTYLYRIFGEDFFNLCETFFSSIRGSGASYKVFASRRCMHLMDLFGRCAGGGSEDVFCSDQALTTRAGEIAEFYVNNGYVPRILIADDVLLYGRTVNGLIAELINDIRKRLSGSGTDYDDGNLKADVLDAISVRVIMRDSQPPLLPGQISRLVRAEEICGAKRRLSFSSCVLTAIVNTGSVSSMNIEHNGPVLAKRLSKQADTCMAASPYFSRFMKKAWIRPLVTPAGDVKAIYTLRAVANDSDRSWTFVPFVILSDVLDFEGDSFNFPDGDCRFSSPMEALNALLCRNLLSLLFNESGTLEITDPGRKTPRFSWEEMDRLILKLTEHSDPLYSLHDNDTADACDNLNTKIEEAAGDIIAAYGFEDETHAYRQRMALEFRTCRHMPLMPFFDLFRKLRQNIDPTIPDNEFLIRAAAVLLRFMDTGALEPVYEIKNGNGISYRAGFRVCDASLFIFAQKYADCIPALSMIERDSIGDFDLFMHSIRRFFPSHRADGLADFVKRLYGAGYRVSDWNIDLSGWSEWVRDNGPALDYDEIRKRNEQAVLTQMAEQSRLAYRYVKRVADDGF